jgi:hypothetical protein
MKAAPRVTAMNLDLGDDRVNGADQRGIGPPALSARATATVIDALAMASKRAVIVERRWTNVG